MSLAITILTGRRPSLLKKTVLSFAQHAGHLLKAAHVTVFVNGGDLPTASFCKTLSWVDDLVIGEEPLKPIGEAISLLMKRVPASVDYVLHLEDDWSCLRGGWYQRAIWILRKHPRVGQVRLRRHYPKSVVGQRTLSYNMVTRQPIKWKEHRGNGFRYRTGVAHFTFNPSLVRRKLLSQIYPCSSERHAMAKFHRKGHLAAQLLPGAFRHIGQNSLRLQQHGRSA